MNDIFYPVVHRSQQEIDALKRRYETFDDSVIPALVKESVGFTATTWVKPSSWGTSHVTYIVSVKERARPVVVRANIGIGEPEVYMQVEKLITDQVAVLGIPVNRIMYVDITRDIHPFDYQIQDALEGNDIEDHFIGTREAYDRMSFDLGRYIAIWGNLTYTGFGRFDAGSAKGGILSGTKSTMYDYIIVRLDEDLKYLADAEVISVERVGLIRTLFETHKPVMSIKNGTLVQYDLADHNIMFDGEKTITGIFDWEAAVIADPMLDLASCPTWKTYYPRENKLIEGYTSIRPLPTFYKERIHIYRLRTMIWKMVYAIRAGILNDDRKKKFEDAVKPFKV